MQKHPSPYLRVVCLALAALLLGACSPKFNWREVRNNEQGFSVMLPSKPASFSRPVNIGGTTVTMTMTAAEVDNVTFAVGSASFKDAAAAAQALEPMKAALVRNINGTMQKETAAAGTIEIEALGTTGQGNARQPTLLMARFVSKDARVYQVLAVGPEKQLSREAADTFFSSFKAH